MTYPTLNRDIQRLNDASAFEFVGADLDRAPREDVATEARWSVQRMLAVSAALSALLWTVLGAIVWQAVHAL